MMENAAVSPKLLNRSAENRIRVALSQRGYVPRLIEMREGVNGGWVVEAEVINPRLRDSYGPVLLGGERAGTEDVLFQIALMEAVDGR